MMPNVKWEKVEYERDRYAESRAKKKQTVWLSKVKKDDKLYRVVNISQDLVKDAGWADGDRVTLYKASKSLFMLRKESVGLETLRLPYKGSKCLRVNSVNLVGVLAPSINGVEFDAWVDESSVIFKPKRKEIA